MADREGKQPTALADRPTPSRLAAPYLSAFKRLHSSRMIAGNGIPLGIALSEIESYAKMFGFDSLEERFDLMHYVKVCDNFWLDEVGKRRKPVGSAKQHPKGRRR